MLKGLGKILHYIKGYRAYAILNIVFNVISQVFNLFTFAMIIPLVQILFNTDQASMDKELKMVYLHLN
jgi:subfamily B ATP-binding cassette protein MsbA